MKSNLTRRILASTALSASFAISLAASPLLAGTTPDTPTVISGSGINFSTNTGVNTTISAGSTATAVDGTASQLNIHLGSNTNSIINWNSFDVASEASVNFSGNSNHAVLNRVTGGTFSSLYGSINGEGVSVFLLNPNGIVFGPDSLIVAGGFHASTLGLADADFLNGSPYSFSGTSSAAITGSPTISTSTSGTVSGVRLGDVVLAARQLDLDATISAAGDVALLAAGSVTMTATPGSPLSFTVGQTNLANGFNLDGSISGSSAFLWMWSSVANTMDLSEATVATTGPGGIQLGAPGSSVTNSIIGTAALSAGGSGSITASAQTNLNLSSAATTGTGQANLTAAEGSMDVGGIESATALTLESGTALTVGDLSAGEVVSVTANSGSVTVSGSITTPGYHVYLASSTGDVSVSGIVDAPVLFGSAAGSFTALAQNSIDALSTIEAGGTLQINNAGSLAVNGPISGGSIVLSSGGDLALNANASGGSTGSITLTAAGMMSGVEGIRLLAQDVTLSADDWTGGILSEAVLQETRDLTINDTAAGFFLGFDLTAQRNLSFNTLNGGSLTLLGKLSSVGNAGTVTASGAEVTIGSAGQMLGRDVVVSSAGAFTNQSGSDALVATGGHWVVYAANPATSTFDGLNSNQTAIWNRTLATLAPGQVSGNRYVFAYQPTLTVTTTGADKTYGDDLTGSLSGMYTLSGLHGGVSGAFLADSAASVFSGAPTITSAGAAANADVAGAPYAVTATQGSMTLLNGYALAIVSSGEIAVDPKALTATVTAHDKIYDATAAGTGSVSLEGVLGGDEVSVTGAAFEFANANAGTDKTVTVSGATLSGADAGNYTVTIPASALADILAKALTVTVSADDKTYDGTLAATGSIGIDGVIGDDQVSVSGASFAFTDKNAGGDKTVEVSGATLSGADAGNYSITVPESVLADILAKQLTATVSADDKTYDGTVTATGSVSLEGVIDGDDVATTGTTFAFASAGAGADKTVTVSGTQLSGAQAGNYTVTVPASALADIAAKALTVTVTANDKTYDGTLAATGSIALDGVIDDDEVSAGASFAFADKNAGTDKTVNLSGAALSGADAGNYTISVPASVLADIAAKALTATVTANDKTYDGTAAATGSIELSGVVDGDQVSAGATFGFADANAGADKVVTVSGATLSGADVGNYTVTFATSATADILAKQLVATVTANDKTYDGATAATGSIALEGVIEGDELTVSGASFAFADKNAGTDKTVSVSGATISGADAGNYVVTVPASAVAEIFKKELVATVTANDKTYDGTTATSGSVALVGVLAGDSVSASGTTFVFADKNAGTDKAVAVSGTVLSGADAGNYAVTVPASAVADILARAIVIAAQDAGKMAGQADPTLTYTVGGAGLVEGDVLTGALVRDGGEAPGAYAIGQGSLSGGGNYTIVFEEGTFTITAAPEEPEEPGEPGRPGEGGQDNFLRALQLPSQGGLPATDRGALSVDGALCEESDEDCVTAE